MPPYPQIVPLSPSSGSPLTIRQIFSISQRSRPPIFSGAGKIWNAAYKAETRAADLVASTVPTTIAGLAADLAFAHYAFGETRLDSEWDNLDAYRFDNWADDRDGRLIRSMLAGAERMAGAAS